MCSEAHLAMEPQSAASWEIISLEDLRIKYAWSETELCDVHAVVWTSQVHMFL